MNKVEEKNKTLGKTKDKKKKLKKTKEKGKLWWNKKYGKDKKCAITQARLRPGGNDKKNKNSMTYVVYLKCGHGFYRQALFKWINTKINQRKKTSCPLCRRVFSVEEAFR